MPSIEKISFDIETLTPMFIAGADGKTAELRPASLKGLLRYWWRALKAEGDLSKLRENEANIFGSVDQKGSFSIRIKHEPYKPISKQLPYHRVPVEGKNFKINILKYLAYGTYDREYIPQGTRFDVIVNIFNEYYKEDIIKIFYVFSLFGGIGSRNRNGFGAFEIINKAKVFDSIKRDFIIDKPYKKENIIKLVKNIDNLSYSCFTQQTKVFRSKKDFDSWDKALADIGEIYRQDRLKLENRHSFDKRRYIGSPIVEKNITHSSLERHAKPYFLKICRDSGKYRAYILYLPSKYCDKLDTDINKQKIDHSKVDKEFKNVCSEFNKFLANKLETVL